MTVKSVEYLWLSVYFCCEVGRAIFQKIIRKNLIAAIILRLQELKAALGVFRGGVFQCTENEGLFFFGESEDLGIVHSASSHASGFQLPVGILTQKILEMDHGDAHGTQAPISCCIPQKNPDQIRKKPLTRAAACGILHFVN